MKTFLTLTLAALATQLHFGICLTYSVAVLTMDDANKGDSLESSHSPLLTPSCNAVDITADRDGGILKELLKESDEHEFPLPGDQVTISYDAIFADGNRFDSSQFRSDNKFEFILGKGDVLLLHNACEILKKSCLLKMHNI